MGRTDGAGKRAEGTVYGYPADEGGSEEIIGRYIDLLTNKKKKV